MLMCACSLIMNIMVICVHEKYKTGGFPKIVKWFIFCCLGRIVMCNRSTSTTSEQDGLDTGSKPKPNLESQGRNFGKHAIRVKTLNEILEHTEDEERKQMKTFPKDHHEEIQPEIMIAVTIMDRSLLLMFSVIFISLSVYAYLYGHSY